MKMNDKLYDVLKWVALIALDAIGLFYSKLCSIWGWPYGDKILETCVAISVLVGTLIGVSSASYKKKQSIEQNAKEEIEE